MPDPRPPAREQPIGTIFKDKGYFTQALWLRGQDGPELEKRLGFRKGRLSHGWTLLFLTVIPQASEYELRGMTYMSDGRVQGHLEQNRNAPFAEQRLASEGYDVERMKRGLIHDLFIITGPKRLARVVPVSPEFGRDDYPPGSGVPQWRLTTPLPFVVADQVRPGGMYLGDYR